MPRKREFDVEAALDAAMLVFWRLGYERATLAELTKAMGINRPSLYAAFGSKEALFRRALEQYASGPDAYEHRALSLPTAREVAIELLRGGADRQTQPGKPHGCLVVLGTRTNGADSSAVGRMLIEARLAGEAEVRERFERALAEGDLSADADPAALALYIRTVIYGMTVMAASGATRVELERVIEVAMRAWPEQRLASSAH